MFLTEDFREQFGGAEPLLEDYPTGGALHSLARSVASVGPVV